MALVNGYDLVTISTHTLRGERDRKRQNNLTANSVFQLTRSVGSVTCFQPVEGWTAEISTHTLRGERDKQ